MVQNLTSCRKADGNVDNADKGNFDPIPWQSPPGYGEREEAENDRIAGSQDGRSCEDQKPDETIAKAAEQGPDEATSDEYTSLGYMSGEVTPTTSVNDVAIPMTTEPSDAETISAEEITAAAISSCENRGELVHKDPEATARHECENNVSGLRFGERIEGNSILPSSTTAESDTLQVRNETRSAAEAEKTPFVQDLCGDSALEEASMGDMGQVGHSAEEVSTAAFHAEGCSHSRWSRS